MRATLLDVTSLKNFCPKDSWARICRSPTVENSGTKAQQHHILELEIQALLEKEVIKESGTEPGEFIFFKV